MSGDELVDGVARAGRGVLLRAVIEFTNNCSHNCAYCGMRRANRTLRRYGLNEEALKQCARRAVEDGIGVVMLQGGDDLRYEVGSLASVVAFVREDLQAEVLLCVGDRRLSDYEALVKAGARQAIIKFETSDREVYRLLRPHGSLEKRIDLLLGVRALGCEVSSGFIQGLPGTTADLVARDIEFTLSLPLFAASVSPFIPGRETPLSGFAPPRLGEVLESIGKLRAGGPDLLIPAVSALNLLSQEEGVQGPCGQLQGLLMGANVLTVNYTPAGERRDYVIYQDRRWIVDLEFARQLKEEAEQRFNIERALFEPEGLVGSATLR